jgi:hypothetical protein
LPNPPTTPLASGAVNGDTITVQLVEPDSKPPMVRITWPGSFDRPRTFEPTSGYGL